MIVLLESVHPDALALLEAAGPVRLMADPLAYDDGLSRGGVRCILTRGRGRITAETYDEFPDLVVVGRCGAGLDNIDVTEATARGIAVVHAPGATTAAVSEHALLLMLGLARRVTMLDAAVKDNRWSIRDGYTGTEMRGKRLGVVGLGAIGRRLAALGRLLGMDVVYWSPSSRDPEFEWIELDALLASSDIVQVCVALAAETRLLLGRHRLGLMRPGALLVNTSRGAVVDHQALRDALAAGRLGGYATDVWDPEPPPAGDLAPIADRLLLTPHVAAITDVTYRDICVRTAGAAIAALAEPGRGP